MKRPSFSRLFFAAAALVTFLPVATAWTAPTDSKPGDVRVTYTKAGTVLRADSSSTSAPAGSLPAGTNVTVLEVKLPWIRVQAGAATGWVRAWETVEPTALAASPPAPYVSGVGEGNVSSREVSAAGRQFSEDTEKDYRGSHPDLAVGYAHVNRMEAETQSMESIDSIAFIMEGNLGRRGRDLTRPARLPPDREESGDPIDLGAIADAAGKLDGIPGLGGLFGGKKPRIPGNVAKAIKLVGMVAKIHRSLAKMQKEFTPTQSYYLGRAVAANAIAKNGIDKNEARRRYVKAIGDAVVRLSDRVGANHGGYHFDVLDSPEVNAVSGPGGFVLITRGAVDACKDEDELAGILCHELAHVTLGHGEAMLRQGPRFQQGVKDLSSAIEGGLDENGAKSRMTGLFGDSVGEMSGRSLGHEYGGNLEYDADREGTYLLYDVLYDHNALRDELRRLGQTGQAQGGAQHAPPEVRAQRLDGVIAALTGPVSTAESKLPRTQRFGATLGRAVTLPQLPPTPPASPPPATTTQPGSPPPPPPPIPLPTR